MGDIIQSKPVVPAESCFPRGVITPFMPCFQPGDVIAERYEVRALLGYGGVGFVLAAADVRSQREVALKFLRPELADQEEIVRKFRIEAMGYAKIRSPHVIHVESVDDLPDGRPFVVMERLEGQDLGSVLEQRGALPLQTAVDYVVQACEGLAAAHASGLRHFDLKPANLFLVDEGQSSEHIELIDFGGSRGPTYAVENVCSGQTLIGIGSPLYMAPEQERGVPEPDDRSDIWSLGCVLYELLSGEPVFARRSDPDGPHSSIIIDEDALGPRLDCAAIPADVEQVIRRCLQQEPSARFHDVAELAAALAPFATQNRVGASERCRALLRLRTSRERMASSGFGLGSAGGEPIAAPAWSATGSLFAARSASRRGALLLVATALASAVVAGYALSALDASESAAMTPYAAPEPATEPVGRRAKAAEPVQEAQAVHVAAVPGAPAAVAAPVVATPGTTAPTGSVVAQPAAARPRVRPALRPIQAAAPSASIDAPTPDVGF